MHSARPRGVVGGSEVVIRGRLSFGGLTVLAILVIAIVVPNVSSGSTGDLSATWEPGSPDPFSAVECPNPLSQLELVESPVREGSRSLRVSIAPQDVWSNGTVRCLVADYDSGEGVGDDFRFDFSLLIPSSGISENLIWELHQPKSLYSLPGCGLAPFALHTDSRKLLFRISTGDCIVDQGASYFEPEIPIPGLDPYPRETWIDVRIRIRFSESDGIVEVWSRTAGQPWPRSPGISRKGIPTMPYSSSARVGDVKLYAEMGLYPGGDEDYADSDTIYLDAYHRTAVSAGRVGTLALVGGLCLAGVLAGLACVLAIRRRGL